MISPGPGYYGSLDINLGMVRATSGFQAIMSISPWVVGDGFQDIRPITDTVIFG